MPQLLVRDLDLGTIARLKASARQHGRSLQGEVKAILQEATTFSIAQAQKVSEQWHRRLGGGAYSDSAGVIREDRER